MILISLYGNIMEKAACCQYTHCDLKPPLQKTNHNLIGSIKIASKLYFCVQFQKHIYKSVKYHTKAAYTHAK